MKLTVKDVAALLNVSEKTIYRWIKREAIPFYRVNQQYRFNRPELLEWASSKHCRVAPNTLVEPERDSDLNLLFREALEAGGIFYRIEGASRDEVLGDIVAHLRLPEEVDRNFLLQVLIAREEMDATVVADGIAAPHPRSPVVRHVARPTVTLCFLDHPVDFGALDGKPVHALFTVVAPTSRSHLRLLSRLAYVLRDPRCLAAIQRQGRREEIFREVRRVESALAQQGLASDEPDRFHGS